MAPQREARETTTFERELKPTISSRQQEFEAVPPDDHLHRRIHFGWSGFLGAPILIFSQVAADSSASAEPAALSEGDELATRTPS